MTQLGKIMLAFVIASMFGVGEASCEEKPEITTEMKMNGTNVQFVVQFDSDSAKLILIHLVSPGDTLWNIAARYGITIQDLLQANPALDQSKPIFANQKIIVSLKETINPLLKKDHADQIPTLVESYKIHSVIPGQTLFSISRLYGVSVDSLTKINHLNSQSHLKIGDELFIPEQVPVILYTVQAGDTLTKISQNFNITVQRLAEWNQLNAKDPILVGQHIQIPKNK